MGLVVRVQAGQAGTVGRRPRGECWGLLGASRLDMSTRVSWRALGLMVSAGGSQRASRLDTSARHGAPFARPLVLPLVARLHSCRSTLARRGLPGHKPLRYVTLGPGSSGLFVVKGREGDGRDQLPGGETLRVRRIRAPLLADR